MKIVKIQNEFKIISSLKPEEIKRLVKAGKNVLYEDKKPVFGINVSENLPSFTAKDATFNQVSDNGYAMLTLSCDQDFYEQFESDEKAIAHFTEDNLAALTNLKAAESVYASELGCLNDSVKALTKEIETISIG